MADYDFILNIFYSCPGHGTIDEDHKNTSVRIAAL
jgi:hypothetical protein